MATAPAASPAAADAGALRESFKLKIEYRPIGQLIPYAANARNHSEKQIAEIAGSIREFGFNDPVAVDGKNGVIEGHGRILAARLLGMARLPVIELGHLTETQKKAYMLAHNRIALNATWSNELLAVELQELQAAGIDAKTLGFSDRELGVLRGVASGLTDENAVPEAPEKAVSREGDLWQLEGHRLICGDSTKTDVVQRVLAGVKPHLMVTDPPYGVEYDPSWRLRAGFNKPGNKLADGKTRNDDRADWRQTWALFPGDVAYIWHGGLHAGPVAQSLEACDFEIRAQIIWAKPSLVIGRGHYHWQHEACWYAVRNSGHWTGDRTQSTLWEIPNMHRTAGEVDDGRTAHSAQKPVECMRRPMENNSSRGQAVYEPFSGSGTSIIAAEQIGRVCHACEIEPRYIDMAVLRWQNFTGKHATLKATGETFAEVMASRLKSTKKRRAAAKADKGDAARGKSGRSRRNQPSESRPRAA